ncbi:MAG: hypothetical protein Q7T11_04340 [Deltaproteobacteria bacterium]|nr:hypothetical protein [Deltaproteobacteria bacterium]
MFAGLMHKFAHFGVLPRAAVKNNLQEVRALVRHRLLRKTYKKGRVFYELTEHSLLALNSVRVQLLEEAKLRRQLYPRRQSMYQALLEDVRFLDTSKKESRDFLFLGDWRLGYEPVVPQLKLSQLRYYQERNLD